jgi:hypothetical protein
MSWSKGILFSFIFFAVFIIVLVVVCVRQEVSLVSKEYYQEEITYQDQIERMRNTMTLEQKPVISVNDRFVQVDYNNFTQIEKGRLDLFCPSNLHFDKSFQLNNQAIQKFEIGSIQKGMYRARLLWTMNGKEFFLEQVITI